uniref:Transmembrane protein n=1 Tax=Cacopsylla melanoneura TaxID=428564 RepID=A0A8D8RE41_9HEMI
MNFNDFSQKVQKEQGTSRVSFLFFKKKSSLLPSCLNILILMILFLSGFFFSLMFVSGLLNTKMESEILCLMITQNCPKMLLHDLITLGFKHQRRQHNIVNFNLIKCFS